MHPRRQVLALAAVGLVTLLSLWRPPFPDEQPLQHLPTAATLGALALAARRRWLSDLAFGALVLLLALHVLGARYIYSNVPYDRWCAELVGWRPSEAFGWRRNHYDRLVHVAFGVLVSPLAFELGRRRGLSAGAAAGLALLAIGGVSALYEVFEWALAMVAAPERAERYNGQQGDPWDAQKDMALALSGGALAALALWGAGRRAPPAG